MSRLIVLPLKFFFTFIFFLHFLGGCSIQSVRAWHKEDLSRPEMQFNSTSTQPAFEQHFYYSKEASSGGESFSGGGCGCN